MSHTPRLAATLALLLPAGCTTSDGGPDRSREFRASPDSSFLISGEETMDRLGSDVALLADGAGGARILAVARRAQQEAGVGYIFDEASSPFGPAVSRVVGRTPGEMLSNLRPAGDFDGDGEEDLAATLHDGAGGSGAVILFGPFSAVKATFEDMVAAGAGTRLVPADLGDETGASIAAAGDVDGDGLGDIIVSAPATASEMLEGKAYVVFGRSSRDAVDLALVQESTGGFAVLGGTPGTTAQALAGCDVNADGLDDVVIGYPLHNDTDGGVLVVAGGTEETVRHDEDGDALAWVSSVGDSARFGTSVACAGDIDADGFPDVAVGAPWRDQGMVSLLTGGHNVSDIASHSTQVPGPLRAVEFGRAVAAAGDFDGDGVDDLLVGGPGTENRGAVWVMFGDPDFSGAEAIRIVGDDPWDMFGEAIAGGLDLTGNGVADVVVGSELGGDSGRLYVFEGGARGL